MYVVYHKPTTLRLDKLNSKTKKEYFDTMQAARAALTRACNKDVTLIKDTFDICPSKYFYDIVEKQEVVQNLMSGKDVYQGVNTPRCLDVSSELYWCM